MNKIKETLDNSPEVVEELKNFFTLVLVDSIKDKKDIPQSFINELQEHKITDELLEMYLTSNPRLICDFMDEQNIIIIINKHENSGWGFTINGEPSVSYFNTRLEAEKQSVVKSISFYKERINQNNE